MINYHQSMFFFLLIFSRDIFSVSMFFCLDDAGAGAVRRGGRG